MRYINTYLLTYFTGLPTSGYGHNIAFTCNEIEACELRRFRSAAPLTNPKSEITDVNCELECLCPKPFKVI